MSAQAGEVDRVAGDRQPTAAAALARPAILGAECFGPSTLLMEYTDESEVYDVVAALGGHLTATVQAGSDGDEFALALVPLLAEHAGRQNVPDAALRDARGPRLVDGRRTG